MPGILSVVGGVIVALTMLDFLATTVSLRREGPMTRLVARVVKGLATSLPDPVASLAGAFALSIVAATWIAGLWLGWTMVFVDAIPQLRGPEGTVVTGIDAAGFAGSLLSTLGLGVLTPTAGSVHVLAVLASISGMVVLTLSVTYVLNVSSIATASRAMALRLDGLREGCETLADGRDDALAADRMAAEYLLQVDASLAADAHQLAEQRESFRLADLYERRGSDRDVVRASVQIGPRIERAARAVDAEIDTLRLDGLAAALRRLETMTE